MTSASDRGRLDAEFDAAWRIAEQIPGWLKPGQARMLFDAVMAAPERPHVLEIGSHQGRSTVVLGRAVQARGGRLTCVDPFVDGRLFGGSATRTRFEENVARAGVADVVELRADYSTALRPQWREPLDVLYIDGKHDVWTFTDDLQWSAFLGPGGHVLVHDAFSSIGVTLGIIGKVLPASRLRFDARSDSMAMFTVAAPTATDRRRVIAQLPWWVRNVGLKVLLRLRARGIAARLGHDSPYDPY